MTDDEGTVVRSAETAGRRAVLNASECPRAEVGGDVVFYNLICNKTAAIRCAPATYW